MPALHAVAAGALLAVWGAPPAALGAQEWNGARAMDLVARASARRSAVLSDTALVDYRARAHGFVFFLGQVGEGLAEEPRLIKADQLELEVYWRAPGRSRQRIIGWRDRVELPTDIRYHRDHLGVVLDNFGDRIRLGEGDEVRDVPHPLAPGGPELYDYALADSLEIRLREGAIRVYQLLVRPRDFRAPRLIGSLYLDVERAELVRMSFSFTRAAYLDAQLEDITVSIENSLWAGRAWLPLRQEIEIRRRATWLDFPARGIIRGRWEIDGYRFNVGLADTLFAGEAIAVASPAVRDSFPWPEPLTAAVRDIARPARLADFRAVRAEVVAMAAGQVLSGLKRRQLGAPAISDFVHVNRVEGLALGLGATARGTSEATELRLRVAWGTASALLTGRAALAVRRGSLTVGAEAGREVRDVGDMPVISRAVNSLLAQEAGLDYGDYYLVTGAGIGVTRALAGRSALRLAVVSERVDSLEVAAAPAAGRFRPNPAFTPGRWTVGVLAVSRGGHGFALERQLTGRVQVEAGAGGSTYLRGVGELMGQRRAGPGRVAVHLFAGAGTRGLPAHRAFVLGGRGTLVGEPFRAISGRYAAWGRLDFRLQVPFPELPLGSFGGTGSRLTVSPFVAAGWAGAAVARAPGRPARGARAVVGVALEWLHELVRVDVGYAPGSRRVGITADVSPDFWGIL